MDLGAYKNHWKVGGVGSRWGLWEQCSTNRTGQGWSPGERWGIRRSLLSSWLKEHTAKAGSGRKDQEVSEAIVIPSLNLQI